jgi:hypothetical protein
MRPTWIRRLTATAAAATAVLALTAIPAEADEVPLIAGCNTTHNHCWTGSIEGGVTVPTAEAWISRPSRETGWFVTIYNHGYSGLVPWVDVLMANGRDVEFPGSSVIASGDPFPITNYDARHYTIVSWRLCDPEVSKCTAFITVPW